MTELFAEKLERFKEVVRAKAISSKNQDIASNPASKLFSSRFAKFKEIIRARSLIFGNQEKMIAPNGQNLGFIFDIRKIILLPEVLTLVAELFWDIYEKEYPFQVGGQESAAIPIITAIVMKGTERGKPVSGFYIRKSRKNIGLQRLIEGTVNDQKIILVDDLVNSGSTIARQLKILRDIGRTPTLIFTIINFRPLEDYPWVKNNKIKHASLFSLNDFGLKCDITQEPLFVESYRTCWKFESKDPNI